MLSANEIRESITNALVQSLSENRIPWRKPWVSLNGPRTATNFVSKRRYSGFEHNSDDGCRNEEQLAY